VRDVVCLAVLPLVKEFRDPRGEDFVVHARPFDLPTEGRVLGAKLCYFAGEIGWHGGLRHGEREQEQ